MLNKKKLDFDVKRYLVADKLQAVERCTIVPLLGVWVAEVLYPDHVVPLHVGEWQQVSAKIADRDTELVGMLGKLI